MTYFTDNELRCKTGELRLAPGFLDKLNGLREEYGRPMIVNSACRSKTYNETIGGHPRSLHLTRNDHHNTEGCCAVDIHATSGEDKGDLIALAWCLGWSVGVASNFLHLDRRSDYTDLNQTLYHYKE